MPTKCEAGSVLLDAALAYAALDWPVLPVAPAGKIPLTVHGLNDASTDPAVIGAWWERWPTANIGIATGPPGPTVIDCDGPIGRHNWSKFMRGIGWHTPWASTGGGGWHIFYSGDSAIRNRACWLRKVDVRGVGGYVVAAPSAHASGGDYWFVHGPGERALGPMPEALREALTAPPITAIRMPEHAAPIGHKYAAAAFEGELDRVRAAPVGARNATLVSAAFNLGQLIGILDAGHVVAALLSAATVAGLGPTEALRTIESGLAAGMTHPRYR